MDGIIRQGAVIFSTQNQIPSMKCIVKYAVPNAMSNEACLDKLASLNRCQTSPTIVMTKTIHFS
jgi:hypothetical protein